LRRKEGIYFLRTTSSTMMRVTLYIMVREHLKEITYHYRRLYFVRPVSLFCQRTEIELMLSYERLEQLVGISNRHRRPIVGLPDHLAMIYRRWLRYIGLSRSAFTDQQWPNQASTKWGRSHIGVATAANASAPLHRSD